jgi:hypothetical protein
MRAVGGLWREWTGARRLCAFAAIGFLWSAAAHAAETQVYLFRGWFGIFSTGLDTIAAELNAKGVKAETLGHLAAQATVARLVKEHGTVKGGRRIVLIGHSQGANNVIEMARALEANNVPVDLLITLAPFWQDPVPGNVVRAINFYTVGWGAPLTAEAGFRGKIANVNVSSSDDSVSHMSIDKSAKVQAEITREILLLSRQK